MLEPLRSFSNETYLFSFNGKEKDDEIKGNAASYNFGARIYDPRSSRFFSVDTKSNLYPNLTPYTFAANNPISLIDKNGNNPGIVVAVAAGAFITIEEAALISWGVITTGFILHKANDGSLQFNDDVKDITNPFGDRTNWVPNTGFPENFAPKPPRDPKNPIDPSSLKTAAKVIAGSALVAGIIKRVHDTYYPPDQNYNSKNGLDFNTNNPLININITNIQTSPNPESSSKLDIRAKYDINYTVQKGDNLSKIAETFHTTVDDLMRTNNIHDKDKIVSGQVLKVGEDTITETKNITPK